MFKKDLIVVSNNFGLDLHVMMCFLDGLMSLVCRIILLVTHCWVSIYFLFELNSLLSV